MAYMHAVAARSSSGVEEEWNSVFILVQDGIEVSVTKDKPPTKHSMWLVSCDLLEPLQQRLVDPLAPKSIDELVIIDGFGLSLFIKAARDIERGDDLFLRRNFLSGFCKRKGCECRRLPGLVTNICHCRHFQGS